MRSLGPLCGQATRSSSRQADHDPRSQTVVTSTSRRLLTHVDCFGLADQSDSIGHVGRIGHILAFGTLAASPHIRPTFKVSPVIVCATTV